MTSSSSTLHPANLRIVLISLFIVILTIQVSLLGEFSAYVEFVLEASATKTWDYNKTVATITLDPIYLDIFGVPVEIDISAPVLVGATATVSVDAIASAYASASGSLEYGLEYDGSDFNPISTKSLTYEGGLDQLSAEITVTASVYVMPVLSIIVECIGGPKVSVKPHVDLQAVAEVDETVISTVVSLLETALDNNIAIASGSSSSS